MKESQKEKSAIAPEHDPAPEIQLPFGPRKHEVHSAFLLIKIKYV